MALEQRIQIKLSQKLVMTQSLQQAIKLLQMSKLELNETLQQELLENPILEDAGDVGDNLEPAPEEKPAEKTEAETFEDKLDQIDMEAYYQDYLGDYQPRQEKEVFDPSDRPNFENLVTRSESLHEHLERQLGLIPITDDGFAIGMEIIGNINDDGYLVSDLEEIAEKREWPLEAVMDIWSQIREFDPLGVAARNLRECLEIQIAYSEWAGTDVETILLEHMDLLKQERYKELMSILNVDRDTLLEYKTAIRSFDPKPGRAFAPMPPQYIQPDVYIVKVDDEYIVQLNDEGTPRLRVSPSYPRILKQGDKETSNYIKDKFKSAMWLIKSLDQRNRTIYKVAESLVRHQRDFFDKGVEYMRPLVLREVADDIGMHESTVSRVVNNKYVHTPRGVFELKYFFRSGLSSAFGEDVSSLAVKEKIRKLCAEESPKKPYSDATIVKILGREGIKIARRTVAKYREELGIPSSSKRREKF